MKQGVAESEKTEAIVTWKSYQQSERGFTMSGDRPARWNIRLDLLLSIYVLIIVFFFVSENPVTQYPRSYHLL